MGLFLFSRVGEYFGSGLQAVTGSSLMSQANRIGSDRFRGRKTQEILSLTLEPMVIWPIFLNPHM